MGKVKSPKTVSVYVQFIPKNDGAQDSKDQIVLFDSVGNIGISEIKNDTATINIETFVGHGDTIEWKLSNNSGLVKISDVIPDLVDESKIFHKHPDKTEDQKGRKIKLKDANNPEGVSEHYVIVCNHIEKQINIDPTVRVPT
jgi:hypothetical protein